MYISPSHPDRQAILDRQERSKVGPEPPEPTGRVLATFARSNRDRPDTELRVVLDEYQGHEYISIRLWERGRGGFWPLRDKGISIRLKEADGVASALVEALGLASPPAARSPTEAAGPRERRSSAPPRGRRRPPTGLPDHHGGADLADDEPY